MPLITVHQRMGNQGPMLLWVCFALFARLRTVATVSGALKSNALSVHPGSRRRSFFGSSSNRSSVARSAL